MKKRNIAQRRAETADSEDDVINNKILQRLILKALLSLVVFYLVYFIWCMPAVKGYSMQELYLSTTWLYLWLSILIYFYPLSRKITRLARKSKKRMLSFISKYCEVIMVVYVIVAIYLSLRTFILNCP